MIIQTQTDRTQLNAFLMADPVYHTYALADLAEPFFSHCRWATAEEDGQIESLVLFFDGLKDISILMALGDPQHLPQILAQADLPRRIMISCRDEHLSHVLANYHAEKLDWMHRMVLPPDLFAPVNTPDAIPLTREHLSQLQALYQATDIPAFGAYQLEQGFFYGIIADGKLVSAAGTHVVSAEHNVAGVGNIATLPAYRGRGFAAQTTTAVCRALFEAGIKTVILNVKQDNAPAVHVYQKLGFQPYCSYWEGIGELTISN